jgi:hypothetical protein
MVDRRDKYQRKRLKMYEGKRRDLEQRRDGETVELFLSGY